MGEVNAKKKGIKDTEAIHLQSASDYLRYNL